MSPVIYLVNRQLRVLKKATLEDLQLVDLRTQKTLAGLTFRSELNENKECSYWAELNNASHKVSESKEMWTLLATPGVQPPFQFNPSLSDKKNFLRQFQNEDAKLIAVSDVDQNNRSEYWYTEDKAFCVGEWDPSRRRLFEMNCVFHPKRGAASN